MRMLYIANVRMPTEKAHGWQIVKTIEALAGRGCAVTLVVPNRRNHITDSPQTYYHLKHSLHIVRMPDWARWLQPVNERVYFTAQRFTFGVQAWLYAMRMSVEAIMTRDITMAFFLHLFGKRVVFEDHEPKRRWQWLYRRFVRALPKKVVVPHGLLSLYETYGVDPATYVWIPNGVDVAAFDAVAPDRRIWKEMQNEPIVLYVGHFYRWKGVYTLIDAAKSIKGHVVLLGGTAEDQAAVREYCKKHKATNVTVKNFVPHAEVVAYLKSADVLVLPNTAYEERSARYTTPIKLFEYMAARVPIVASDLLSFSAFLQDGKTALLCRPDDAADLAEKVNTVLNNRVLARTLTEAAYEQARGYDWQVRAKKVVAFLQK